MRYPKPIAAFSLALLFTAGVVLGLAPKAQGQITYTNDTTLSDFTSKVTRYATFNNFNDGICQYGCDTNYPLYLPDNATLAQGFRVYGGTYVNPGLDPNNNWIQVSFPYAVSSIIVFPNIDHYGAAFDGYQYSIWASKDGVNWTELFDALTVNPAAGAPGGPGEPFTLGTFTGTAPTSVSNYLMTTGGAGPYGTVGYIATFNFPTAYQYYAFGASAAAIAANNSDQELSAVGTTVPPPPNSGAMLEIKGTVSGTPIDLRLYDSQIHTGTVQTPAFPGNSCVPGDEIPTDAYLLQAGAPAGCDPGVTGAASLNASQTFKLVSTSPAYEFDISTQYVCGGVSEGSCTAGNQTNSSLTVTSNDTGFLTVASNSTSFNGTVTLSGVPGSAACPLPTGQASWTDTAQTLPAVLAISTNSRVCQGFNVDQVSPVTTTPNQPFAFTFGNDAFTVTPANIAAGEVITYRPVPQPASMFNLNLLSPSVAPPWTPIPPASNPVGTNLYCVSIADFAANLNGGAASTPNPVCPEFQTACYLANLQTGAPTTTPCPDGETFVWTGLFNAHLDQNAGYPVSGSPAIAQIGGVHFLGAPGVSCPQNMYSTDVIVSYTGDTPDDLPLHSGGSGLNCFVTAYDPTLPVVPAGVVASAFAGFFFPVSDIQLNPICPGCIVPLLWMSANGAGGLPLKNLSLCLNPNPATSSGCGAVPKPWVYLSQTPYTCPDGTPSNISAGPIQPVKPLLLGFINLTKGYYAFNWQTAPKTATGCTTVNMQFSNGSVVQPAKFQFGKIHGI